MENVSFSDFTPPTHGHTGSVQVDFLYGINYISFEAPKHRKALKRLIMRRLDINAHLQQHLVTQG